MEKYIWIGHKESEIYKIENIFAYSITSWGSSENNNISYSEKFSTREIDNEEKKEFITNVLNNLLCENEYKVMFYSSTLAYSLINKNPNFQKNFICLNKKSVLDFLNNKISTRLWFSNYMPVISFVLLSGKECNYKNLCKSFQQRSFVIQEADSSGGLGTYILNNENFIELEKQFNNDYLYLVSIYASPSFSINSHVLVTNEASIVFQPSIQLIQQYDNKLIYSGADFKAYINVKNEYKEKVYNYSKVVAEHLRNIGYRGICGIDFIVYENNVYFVEVNPRFQASTFLINIALTESNLPSIQELQLKIFHNELIQNVELLEKLPIDYSFYKYKKEKQDNNSQYLKKLELLENSSEKYDILYDGFKRASYKENIYLYEVIWKHHISSCLEDEKLHLHPNIPMLYFMDNAFPLTYTRDQLIRLKISLLNQGIRISPKASSEIEDTGGFNESVFNSIDIVLLNNLRINAPVNIYLSSLSPYELDVKDGKYYLLYYNVNVCEVKLEFNRSFVNLKTQNGIPYKQIAFISGDRLRIKPEAACYYKINGFGCTFCHENKTEKTKINNLDLKDIFEVVDYCIQNEQFRHILIGGGSADPSTDDNKIIPVIEYIRSKTDKPIYLMCLPPNDVLYINKYCAAGVNEIAFNIELFDRSLAQKYKQLHFEIRIWNISAR